jgi:uncharacterized protein (TIGR00369 family)
MLGTQLTAYGKDGVELKLPMTDLLRQQHGFAHGGVLAYLADNALTFAGGIVMGGGVLTADLKLNYIRPGIGQLLIARAIAVSRGEVIAVDQGVEKVCLIAQGMVLRAGQAPKSPVSTVAEATS